MKPPNRVRPLRRSAGRSAPLNANAAHSVNRRIRGPRSARPLCSLQPHPCSPMPRRCDGAGGCEQLRASQIRDARGQLIAKTHRLQRFWGRVQAVEINPATASVLKPLEAIKTRSRRAKTHKPPCQTKMILTNCAACAAPLAHNAPRCVRCHVRYCRDPGATLDDLREAVTTLEDLERAARRVMGGAHPLTSTIERHVGLAQIALRDRETPLAAEPPSPEDELDELDDV